MAVVACGDDVAQPRNRYRGSGYEAQETRVVGVVAVADNVVLHLGHHVIELASLLRNAAAADGIEHRFRRLGNHGAFGQVTVAREQLAHKAHGCEFDIGLGRGSLGIHGGLPFVRGCCWNPSCRGA